MGMQLVTFGQWLTDKGLKCTEMTLVHEQMVAHDKLVIQRKLSQAKVLL